MTNDKRYIVEKIVAKLMNSCTIHDSGLFICTLNKELDNYHQTEINKLNKSDVISSVCEHPYNSVIGDNDSNAICLKCGVIID